MEVSKNLLCLIISAITISAHAQTEFKPNSSWALQYDLEQDKLLSTTDSANYHETINPVSSSTTLQSSILRRPDENIHASHYFVGPSAIPNQKGLGVFRNNMLLVNSLTYGLTKNLSVTGGMEVSSIFKNNLTWFVNAKAGFEVIDNFHIAGGYLHIQSSERTEASQFIGLFTVGDEFTSITFGGSYGEIKEQSNTKPVLMLSASHMLVQQLGLITENQIIPTVNGKSNYVGMLGIRFITRESAIDVGLGYTDAETDINTPVLPFFGYSLLF